MSCTPSSSIGHENSRSESNLPLFDSGFIKRSVLDELDQELDHLDYVSERSKSATNNHSPSSNAHHGSLGHNFIGSQDDVGLLLSTTTTAHRKADASKHVIYSPPPQEQFASFRRVHLLICMTMFSTITSLITVFYVLTRYVQISEVIDPMNSIFSKNMEITSRLAFGSCLQRDIGKQPVWKSVIGVSPHVWIWLGDFVYVTHNPSCVGEECRCEGGFASIGHKNCKSADMFYHLNRYMQQLSQDDYRMFLQFMCPNSNDAVVSGSLHQCTWFIAEPLSVIIRGIVVVGYRCQRSIIGTWDDNDFGWNDGNGRYPYKSEAKQLYLDAVGELRDSARRSSVKGIEHRYKFNNGDKHREISVYLLDTRYYREPLDCRTLWHTCNEVLKITKKRSESSLTAEVEVDSQSKPAATAKEKLCEDFIKRGKGCCFKDAYFWDRTSGWCHKHLKDSSLPESYEELCNPASSLFGSRLWHINEQDKTFDTSGTQASFCDILGSTQRQWLNRELSSSTSRVNIIASSTVVVDDIATCFDRNNSHFDTWECYKPAQQNLISTISRSDASCVIIITGDKHFGDIKLLKPGTKYSQDYKAEELKYPLYQVMSSGMTDEMIMNPTQLALTDSLDLRPNNTSPVFTANFGLIDIDWHQQTMKLQIRAAAESSIKAESVVDLRKCAVRRTAP